MASFDVRPLPNRIGKEVVGLDIADDIAPGSARALRQLWLDEGVLLFRGVGTSPDALLRLSRCFGELELHPIKRFRLEGYPELIELTNRGDATSPVYLFDGVPTYGRIPWHTDLAFATTPNAGALLRMVQKTRTGGRTGWIDTALAFDALEEAMKDRIASLEARYVFRGSLDDLKFNNPGGVRMDKAPEAYPHFAPVANPLVWTHPETGQRVLNISTLNIDGIIGMDDEAGAELIEALIDHALQPRFQYVHDWENDDVMLWDNRRTMHCAFGHPVEEIRIVQRSTIKGRVQMGRVLEDEAVPA